MPSKNPFCLCSSRRNEVHNSDEEFSQHEQQLNQNLNDMEIVYSMRLPKVLFMK
jgi:hypothetical protein